MSGTSTGPGQFGSASRRSLLRGIGGTAAVVGSATALTACGAANTHASTVTVSTASKTQIPFPIDVTKWPKGKKIGMLAAPPQYDIDKRMNDAAVALAKQAGWHYNVVDVSQSDPNAAAKGWAAQKYDGVVSLYISPAYFAAGAAALKAANIPIAGVIAGDAEGLTFDVQGDDWTATANLCTWGLNQLGGISPAAGLAHGGVAILAVPSAMHQGIRVRVLKNMVTYVPGMKIVAEPGLNTSDLVGDSKNQTAALLNQYPKGQLNWIFAADSTFGVAAAQAIKAAGRSDVFVTGCNGVLQEFDGIRSDGPNQAAIFESVEYAAQVAMQQLAMVLAGQKPLARTLYIDEPLITKDNVPAPGKYPTIEAGLTQATATVRA